MFSVFLELVSVGFCLVWMYRKGRVRVNILFDEESFVIFFVFILVFFGMSVG